MACHNTEQHITHYHPYVPLSAYLTSVQCVDVQRYVNCYHQPTITDQRTGSDKATDLVEQF